MADNDRLISIAQDLLERSEGRGGGASQRYRQAVVRVARSIAKGSEVTTPRLSRQIRELHLLNVGVVASLEAISESIPREVEHLSGEIFSDLIERFVCTSGCRKKWDECFEDVRESTDGGGDPGDPIPATPEALEGVAACDLAFATCLLDCGLFVW